jgi:hypothetical protein
MVARKWLNKVNQDLIVGKEKNDLLLKTFKGLTKN